MGLNVPKLSHLKASLNQSWSLQPVSSQSLSDESPYLPPPSQDGSDSLATEPVSSVDCGEFLGLPCRCLTRKRSGGRCPNSQVSVTPKESNPGL